LELAEYPVAVQKLSVPRLAFEIELSILLSNLIMAWIYPSALLALPPASEPDGKAAFPGF
jgi:hypothetical protein